ncbi:MAG: Ig-like domain-containing protein, partial [Verrucomicrobiota bacterium]
MSGRYSLELLEPRVMLSADGLSAGVIAHGPADELSALGAIAAIEVSQATGRSEMPQEIQAGMAPAPGAVLDDLFAGVEMARLDDGGDQPHASAALQDQTSKPSDHTGFLLKTGGLTPKINPAPLPTPLPGTDYVKKYRPSASNNISVGTVLYFSVTGSSTGSAWGSGIYTDDTPLGIAAVHAGLLSAGDTAILQVTIRGAQDSFVGSSANGVTTNQYGSWDGSYSFTSTETSSYIEDFTDITVADWRKLAYSGNTSGNYATLSGNWRATWGTSPAQATLKNGWLQLTDNSNFQNVAVGLIKNISTTNAFSAEFDLYISDLNGADGFSFNFGAPDVAKGTIESSSTFLKFENGIISSGLSVSFKQYGPDRMDVRYWKNGAVVADWRDQTIGNFSNFGRLTGQEWLGERVKILVTESGVLSITVGGKGGGASTVWTQTVPGYQSDNKASWKFGFGARTGGSASIHAIDNLSIQSAPTVVSVSSSAANGSYGTSSVIPIQIKLSKAVNVVGGVPYLTLASGGTATYVSGSGTDTLTFNYSIASGQNSADLDYVGATSLTLPQGVTISDGAGNSAVLTLASPGTNGSLGASKAIVVDTAGPTVTSISSPTTNGTYGVGSVISIQVNFSEAVTVAGGAPALALNSGGTATYISGSGTSTLTFSYSVAGGQNATDLDYGTTASLALPGGVTIKDIAGNAATLTLASPGGSGSMGASKAIVVDTPPIVTSINSSTANGTYGVGSLISIQVNFSEAVNVAGGNPTLALNSVGTATYGSGSGTSTLNFNYTIASGQNATDLDYTPTASLTLPNGVTIKDTVGNNAVLTLAAPNATGSLGANKAIAVDTQPLVLSLPASIATNSVGGQITLPGGALGTSGSVIRTLILSVPTGATLTANDVGTYGISGTSTGNTLTLVGTDNALSNYLAIPGKILFNGVAGASVTLTATVQRRNGTTVLAATTAQATLIVTGSTGSALSPIIQSLPGTLQITAGESSALLFTNASLDDGNSSDNDTLSLTLGVPTGALSATGTTGTGGVTVSGTATSLVLSGKASDLLAVLRGTT